LSLAFIGVLPPDQSFCWQWIGRDEFTPQVENEIQMAKTLTWAGLAALAAAVMAAAFYFDQPVREAIVAAQGKGWKKTADYRINGAVRRYGDWPYLMLGGGAGLILAWRLKNGRWPRILAAAMVASTLAGILVNASRLTTGRTRPRSSPKIEQGWYGVYYQGKVLIGDSAYNAFPSGHTATAFGFAGVVLYAAPVWGVFAMVLAGWVAWSSIAIGAHHVSDVAVAVVLSMAIAWVCWRLAVSQGDAVARWIQAKFRRRRTD
jgi:membrane-associated phospholipid phosphatase